MLKKLAEWSTIALAILSGIETIAGAGATIIVLGELLHIWDLL